MNRRNLLKSFLALPLVTGLAEATKKVNPFKVKRKPKTICIDEDNFPEAHLDMKTGDLYMKTNLDHLTRYYDSFEGEVFSKKTLDEEDE